MPTPNTNLNVTIIDSVNNFVAEAQVIITVAGAVYNLLTNSNGLATTTISLTNVTIGTISVIAPGYISNSQTYTINPITNSITILLSVDSTQINKALQISDISGNPVAGVNVSVNGTVVGKTSSAGLIQVVTKAGYITIQTSKAGYNPLILTQSYTAFNFPSQIIIQLKAGTKQLITFQTTPFSTIQIAGNGLVDTTKTDATGTAITNIAFGAGVYDVLVSRTGYTSSSVAISINSLVSSYVIAPLQGVNTDPSVISSSSISSLVTTQIDNSGAIISLVDSTAGVSLGTASTSSGTSSSTPGVLASKTASTTVGTSEQAYPSEWIYPNNSQGKYLTGTQARIYIGNLFIDEIDTLYYAFNNNRIPVYGYSSANVDAFGQGRRLVQGQLSVNFVSEGYLFTVLSEYSNKFGSASLSPSQQNNKDAVANLAGLYTQLETLLAQKSSGSSSTGVDTQIASIQSQ
ncbi:MAG: hypothetical protein ACRYGG_16215, partial [Janthinobacterium lividum]